MSSGHSGCFCFWQSGEIGSVYLIGSHRQNPFLDRIKSSHGVKKGYILDLPVCSTRDKKAAALANQRGRQLYITLLTQLGIMTTLAQQGQELVDFTTLEMDAGVGDLT